MKTIFAAAFVWSALSFSAHATPLFAKCVQNQLVSLGYDPGPVGGHVGPKTIQATESLIASVPELVYLPKLTNRYAVTWCRKLGNLQQNTKTFWPSNKDAIFLTETSDGQQLLSFAIYGAVFEVQKFLEIRHGIQLASRVDVVAAIGYPEAHKRTNSLINEISEARYPLSIFEKLCKQKNHMVGLSTYSQIVFCFPKNTKLDAQWTRRNTLNLLHVVAHEHFHQVQREFSASKGAYRL